MKYQTTNYLCREVLPTVDGNTFALIMAVASGTLGWGKDSAEYTVSDLQEMTGMARATVVRAVKTAIESGHLTREKVGRKYAFSVVIPANSSEMERSDFELQQPYSSKSERLQFKNGTLAVQNRNASSSDLITSTSGAKEVKEKKKNIYKESEIPKFDAEEFDKQNEYALLEAEVCTCSKRQPLVLREPDRRLIDSMFKAGYTPEQVKAGYRDRKAAWWYLEFWKGKKGQVPTIRDIAETIGQAVDYTPKTAEETAADTLMSWDELYALAARYGVHRFPADQVNPVTRRAINHAGGWQQVAQGHAPTVRSKYQQFGRVPA